jgi:hypothetical protein
MAAAVLLHVLDPEFLGHAKLAGYKALSHLKGLATTRNRSVLAHGERPVKPEAAQMLAVRARFALDAHWWAVQADGDVADLCRRLQFLRTDR